MLQGGGRDARRDGVTAPSKPVSKARNNDGGSSNGGAHILPHVAQMWEAACAGDADTVRTLLSRHRLPATMLHPETGSSLLLDVAAVETMQTQKDFRLAEVIKVLVNNGCSLREQLPPANDTPMHLLAAQPRNCHVEQRVLILLRMVTHDYISDTCALALRDARGLLPEDAAAAAALPDLCELLRVSRTKWPEQAQARRDDKMRERLSKAQRLVLSE